MDSKKNAQITFRCKESLREALEKEAEKQGRTLSNYIEYILTKNVKENTKSE